MILLVRVPAWVLDEDRRCISVGDELSSWLTFEDEERPGLSGAAIRTLQGVAHVLRPWPGSEDGCIPTALVVGGTTLYWDAPRRAEGPVEISGTISTNNVDAPDGFPCTTGVVRRVRMEWRRLEDGQHGAATFVGAEALHEDVSSTYLPGWDDGPLTDLGEPAPRRLRWTGCLVDLEVGGSPGG